MFLTLCNKSMFKTTKKKKEIQIIEIIYLSGT